MDESSRIRKGNYKMNELLIMIEDTKRKMNMEINKIIHDSNLPCYLIEGIIVGILSDIREGKILEMLEAIREKEGKGEE